MCYIEDKGSTFGKILKVSISSVSQEEYFGSIIRDWCTLGLGWDTDEFLFYKMLMASNGFRTQCAKLERRSWKPSAFERIDRGNWKIDKELLKSGSYIDAHLPRPLNIYIYVPCGL